MPEIKGVFIISNYDIFLLQLLFCKNKANLKECVAAIALLLYKKVHSSIRWLNTSEKSDDCKCLSQRNTVPLKILDHSKWPPEIMMVRHKCMAESTPLKYIVYLQFMAASALQKNTVSIEEWMAATTFVKQRYTVLLSA